MVKAVGRGGCERCLRSWTIRLDISCELMVDWCKDDIFWEVRRRFIKFLNHVILGLTHDDRPPVLEEPPKKRARVMTSGAQLSPSWEVDQVSWSSNSTRSERGGVYCTPFLLQIQDGTMTFLC